MNCHVWKFCKDLFLNLRVIWSVNQIVLFNGFLSDFVEITLCVCTKTIILFNLSIQRIIVNYQLLTNRARGPYWGTLAQGRGRKDPAQRGQYCHDWGPMFPSTTRASSVSNLFIIWHSASYRKMHFRWLALKGFPLWRILYDATTSDRSKLPRVRKTNSLNVKSS